MQTLLKSKYQRASHVVGSSLDDAMILSSMENEKFYGLNKVASRIWKILEESVTMEEVVVKMLDQFDIEKKACEQDVSAFFQEMIKAGIIVEVPA